MGQNNSKSKNDNDTLNWKDIQTDNISSIHYNNHVLHKDVKQLISNLNIPTLSDVSELNYDDIINSNKKSNKIYNNSTKIISNDVSNTSPFITSEMYNNLLNSKTSDISELYQKGGAKKKVAKKSKVSNLVKNTKKKKIN